MDGLFAACYSAVDDLEHALKVVADALYVVIARRLDVALVTGDVRLAQAPGLGVHVLTS